VKEWFLKEFAPIPKVRKTVKPRLRKVLLGAAALSANGKYLEKLTRNFIGRNGERSGGKSSEEERGELWKKIQPGRNGKKHLPRPKICFKGGLGKEDAK